MPTRIAVCHFSVHELAVRIRSYACFTDPRGRSDPPARAGTVCVASSACLASQVSSFQADYPVSG